MVGRIHSIFMFHVLKTLSQNSFSSNCALLRNNSISPPVSGQATDKSPIMEIDPTGAENASDMFDTADHQLNCGVILFID